MSERCPTCGDLFADLSAHFHARRWGKLEATRRQRGCADPNCNGTCLRPGAILRDGLVLWPVHDWDIADRERDNLANGH